MAKKELTPKEKKARAAYMKEYNRKRNEAKRAAKGETPAPAETPAVETPAAAAPKNGNGNGKKETVAATVVKEATAAADDRIAKLIELTNKWKELNAQVSQVSEQIRKLATL